MSRTGAVTQVGVYELKTNLALARELDLPLATREGAIIRSARALGVRVFTSS